MTITPDVSVLLPFLNSEKTLGFAIESVLRQSLQNLQLVLVNNNSGPAASELAAEYARKDVRILLVHEAQAGIAFALNAGLKYCSAPLIARMDADDIAHPQRLEKQQRYLLQNPEVGVVSCRTYMPEHETDNTGYRLFADWQNNLISTQQHAHYRFVESPLAHPSAMFRSSLIQQWGNYSTAAEPEDYELWLRWMNKGVLFYKLPETLLQWNDRADRLSRTHTHYSERAFYELKCRYLAHYIRTHVSPHKKVVVCGTGKDSRTRAALLEKNGVTVSAFTDVVHKQHTPYPFIPLSHITEPAPWLLINFISKRGVSAHIEHYLTSLGFEHMRDFILAA
jgi:glycosyltransferase involved in cell wall biosynthesis